MFKYANELYALSHDIFDPYTEERNVVHISQPFCI